MSSEEPASDLDLPVYPTASVPDLEASPSELRRAEGALSELPERIAEYEIHRTIGRGGMGIVYEGEQVRLHRRVAIKLISPGLLRESAQRRFEYEAHLLARLDHPGIARIYHAGIWEGTAGPQPFFAMELVDGIKLDEYLKENRPRLKLRQLIELFHEICSAVQHAHSRGIVHRDLKPDNMLIISRGPGGEPVEPKPKILDFGVARAIDADTQATTVHTESGALVGTIPYMAPEQIRGEVDDLDQATDVYALGVIGYEILSDRMPYPVKGRPLPEAARIICEDEPSRLSSVNRNLRGDVETIVQKALEKEKTCRYSSAGELAADVRRYLDYEPITARPPGKWYNLKKFARRNKLTVTGVVLLILVLAGGVVTSTRYAISASRERDNANATLEFLTNDVLSGATPESIPDAEVRDQIVRAMITPAASRVAITFKDHPLIEASVRNAIVTVLDKIGRSDLAVSHAEVALALRLRLLGGEHPDTILSKNNYASVLDSLGRWSEAEPLYKQALEYNRRRLGDDHPNALSSLNNYANVLVSMGRAAEAEPMCKENLERCRSVLGAEHPDTISSLNNYAGVLDTLGRIGEAEPLYKQAMDIRRRVLGDKHLDSIVSMNNYAAVLENLGRATDAEPIYKEALQHCRHVLGADHPLTITLLNNNASVLKSLRRFAEAESLYKEVLESCHRVLGDDHPDTIMSLNNYAGVLMRLGRLGEAESLYSEALDRRRRALGEGHPYTISTSSNYAAVLELLGRAAEAEPLAREAVAKASAHRSLGPQHPSTIAFAKTHAKCLDALNRHDDATVVRKQFGLPEPTTHPATTPTTKPSQE